MASDRNEVLQLVPEDVSLPEYRHDASGEVAIIALGTRAGTKAKREQATMLRDSYLVGLLRFLVRTASVDGPLVGVSYTTYRKLLKKVESLIGISAGYTPHSPRAGFAS